MPPATTAIAATPTIAFSDLVRRRVAVGWKVMRRCGGFSAPTRSNLARSALSSRGPMSIILELLSKRGEAAFEMGSHRSRAAPHEYGALVDGIAVPVVERDCRALLVGQAPIGAIHVDSLRVR